MQLAAPFSKDAAVVLCAATLIPIAGVFQIFDGLQVDVHHGGSVRLQLARGRHLGPTRGFGLDV